MKVDSSWSKTVTAENDVYPGTKYVQGSTQTFSQTTETSFVSTQVEIKMMCLQLLEM